MESPVFERFEFFTYNQRYFVVMVID